MDRVLPTDTPQRSQRAIELAAAALARGEIVAIPTETVYGLAAHAFDERAVQRVFEAKGRPAVNPLIVHVASVEMAKRCARSWPDAAERVAAGLWPGPVTIVVERSSVVPDVVTAGGDTVALRWPAHPLATGIIQSAGLPIAAPSANRSNCLSPTTAQHVADGIGERVDLIVDGGPCRVGIESTVLDVTCVPARILRPGIVGRTVLEQVLGEGAVLEHVETRSVSSGTLRSPGTLGRHYAPRALLRVRPITSLAALAEELREAGDDPAHVHLVLRGGSSGAAVGFASATGLPAEPASFARELYAVLHGLDEGGARMVVVQAPPEEAAWNGVRDRLARAAAPE